eukprot:m.760529 g.760529  ORF g.760529 m.760529 type:complete len:76 (+) comp23200_c1_seq13:265-492(+)
MARHVDFDTLTWIRCEAATLDGSCLAVQSLEVCVDGGKPVLHTLQLRIGCHVSRQPPCASRGVIVRIGFLRFDQN